MRSCANRFLPNMAPARLLFQLRKHTVLYTTLHYFCNKGDFKIIYVASIGVYDCLHWTKLMSLGKMRWYLPGSLYSGRMGRPKQPAWGDFFLGIRWKRVERGRFLPALCTTKNLRGENGLARLESHLGEQNRATYRLRILEGRLRRLI